MDAGLQRASRRERAPAAREGGLWAPPRLRSRSTCQGAPGVDECSRCSPPPRRRTGGPVAAAAGPLRAARAHQPRRHGRGLARPRSGARPRRRNRAVRSASVDDVAWHRALAREAHLMAGVSHPSMVRVSMSQTTTRPGSSWSYAKAGRWPTRSRRPRRSRSGSHGCSTSRPRYRPPTMAGGAPRSGAEQRAGAGGRARGGQRLGWRWGGVACLVDPRLAAPGGDGRGGAGARRHAALHGARTTAAGPSMRAPTSSPSARWRGRPSTACGRSRGMARRAAPREGARRGCRSVARRRAAWILPILRRGLAPRPAIREAEHGRDAESSGANGTPRALARFAAALVVVGGGAGWWARRARPTVPSPGPARALARGRADARNRADARRAIDRHAIELDASWATACRNRPARWPRRVTPASRRVAPRCVRCSTRSRATTARSRIASTRRPRSSSPSRFDGSTRSDPRCRGSARCPACPPRHGFRHSSVATATRSPRWRRR